MDEIIITRHNGKTIKLKSISEMDIHENLQFRFKNFLLNEVMWKFSKKEIHKKYYDKFMKIVYKTSIYYTNYVDKDTTISDLKDLFCSKKTYSLEAKAGEIDGVLLYIDEAELVPFGNHEDSQFKTYTSTDADLVRSTRELFSLKDNRDGVVEPDSFEERAMNFYKNPNTKFEFKAERTISFEFLFYLFVNGYQKGIYLLKSCDRKYGILIDKEGYEKIELRYLTFLCDIGQVFEKLAEKEKIDLSKFQDCKDKFSLRQFKSEDMCSFENLAFTKDGCLETNNEKLSISGAINKYAKSDDEKKKITQAIKLIFAILMVHKTSHKDEIDMSDKKLLRYYRDSSDLFSSEGLSLRKRVKNVERIFDSKEEKKKIISRVNGLLDDLGCNFQIKLRFDDGRLETKGYCSLEENI